MSWPTTLFSFNILLLISASYLSNRTLCYHEVAGMLALKKAKYATPLLLPLNIATVLFQFYIGQKHWKVAGLLPSRKCLQCDRINEDRDLHFLGEAFIQPEMRKKEGV